MNETLKRALSGAVYVLLLIASISYSTESFFILFGIFMVIAVFEFCILVKVPKLLPIIASVIIYSLFFKYRIGREGEQLLLAATLIVSVMGIRFLFDNSTTVVKKLPAYLYLLGYIIFPFILITKIPFGIRGYNPKILISIFILIWTNDTFAYIVGKSIGKHKLFERISPKKTIEGFVGGMLFAVLAGYLISLYYIEGATMIWIVIALIVGVFGTTGDLIESKFKRLAGVKDSGNIMPGHGGILDRLDSVIFVAPFVYLFYQILYYA